MHNQLWFGDNLDILQREIDDQSVDLVYLDPPFNSKAKYNLLYETSQNEREAAQQTVFRDSWSWGAEAEFCFERVLATGGQVAAIVNALTIALQRSDMMAYLVMMAARLIEIHRVLKPTGSVYLHCDPTASHYLKVLLDSIFGVSGYRNEIVWKRQSAHNDARKKFADITDSIFCYTKSNVAKFNVVRRPLDPDYVESFYRYTDKKGRRYRLSDLRSPNPRPNLTYDYKGYKPHENGWAVSLERMKELDKEERLQFPKNLTGRISLRRYLDENEGAVVPNLWDDILPLHGTHRELIGYPTQKPLALLERIISASSDEGDIVLDPFCGCGTTIHAAAKLRRKWVGIDVSYYAIKLIERRLKHEFGANFDVPVDGIPKDLASAEALAERDPYAFQQWAISEFGCQLWNDGKKGRDTGIDGEMWFMSGPGKPAGRLLVQVKGGKRAGASEVRDFVHVLDREKADLGIFFCRNEPSADMRREATTAKTYRIGSVTMPRLQVFTLGEWFAGQRPRMPMPIPLTVSKDRATLKRPRVKRPDPRQPQFALSIEGGLTKPKKGQVINPAALPDEAIRGAA